jgi:Ca2+-binding EF-hand superfamily protein
MLVKNAKAQKEAGKSLITPQNLEEKVLEKINFQWKTLNKAFKNLDLDKTGKIYPHNFRFYLEHWGMDVPDEEFNKLFKKFDVDGDGVLSYEDF